MPWDWKTLGGVVTSGPAACTYCGPEIHVFARGQDNFLWHKWTDGTAWFDWSVLGSLPIASGPGAACWGRGRADVCAQGENGELLHIWHDSDDWSPASWSDWESLNLEGNPKVGAAPAVISRAPGELLIVFEAVNSALLTKAWGAHGWEPVRQWTDGEPDPPNVQVPAVTSWHIDGRLDTFMVGLDNSVFHRSFDRRNGFGEWEDIGGSVSSGLGAASLSPGHLAVYGRGQDGTLWENFFAQSHGWLGWRKVPGNVPITSAPAAIATATTPHTYAVFARGENNDVIVYAYQAPQHKAGGGGSHWYNDLGNDLGDIFSDIWEELQSISFDSSGSGGDGGDGG